MNDEFYWDDLLDFLVENHNVVPVVGRELLMVEQADGAVPFQSLLARELSQRPEIDAGVSDDLNKVIVDVLQKGPRKDKLTRAIKEVHQTLVESVQLPEGLRKLAEIRDFRLYLTTTADGLLARALREVRGVEPRILAAGSGRENDLSEGWDAGAAPTVYHLFGKITATPGFALTEEDMLEYMWALQTERRPKRLFDEILCSHVLLLGNAFPNWLARFFLRLMKGCRLTEEDETFEAVADSVLGDKNEKQLVTFLENFSHQTRIYRSGGASEFVGELYDRWKAKRRPIPATAGDYEPEDMAPGSIFISYAREDGNAAQRLHDGLAREHFDVWFDRIRLKGGDPFAEKIQRHIRNCDLFVPIISSHTNHRGEGFVFKEWRWAMDRASGIQHGNFILPLIVDALEVGDIVGVAESFRHLDIRRSRDGHLTPELLEHFRRNFREIQWRRPTRAA